MLQNTIGLGKQGKGGGSFTFTPRIRDHVRFVEFFHNVKNASLNY